MRWNDACFTVDCIDSLRCYCGDDVKSMNLFYGELGKSIAKCRTASGFSQEKLAAKICLSRPTLTNIELGKQRVQVHQLIRIASVLQISVEELLTS